MTVDLVERDGRAIGDSRYPFEIDDYTRWRLLEGLDDIGLTLRDEARITEFEARRESLAAATLPVTQAARAGDSEFRRSTAVTKTLERRPAADVGLTATASRSAAASR